MRYAHPFLIAILVAFGMAALLLFFVATNGFSQGSPLPSVQNEFFGATGVAAPLGFVCTTASGTTTPLSTYREVELTNANQNPIRLNSAGRPSFSGSEVSVFLQAAVYRITVYAAGTGNTCNGTTVGSVLRTADGISGANIYTASFATKLDDKVCHASQYAGATDGAKIAACIAVLPSTGGTVDARGLEGTGTWTADFFSGITKPVHLIMAAGTKTLSANMTVPANVTIEFIEGSIISANTGLTLTYNGGINAPQTQIFAGAGTVTISGGVPEIYPQWFAGSEPGAQLTAAHAAVPTAGGVTINASAYSGAQAMTSKVSITKPGVRILFGCATFTLSGVAAVQSPFGANFLISSSGVWLIGTPGCTVFKLAAASESNPVTFIHGATLGGVQDIEFDGNKANNTSIVDDSFQSAIQIISDSRSGATVDARITIERCLMHDFNHYGVVTYGNLSSGNNIRYNRVYSNGKSGDAASTGDGIFINYDSGDNTVEGNYTYSNNRSGIRLSAVSGGSAPVTAGVATNNKIVNNWTYSNTIHGILASEEANLGSIPSSAQNGLHIRGNHSYSNTQDGVRIGTFNNVGTIQNAIVEGNTIYSNSGYGLLVQSNAGTSNVQETLILGNQVYDNTLDGISIAADVIDTTINNNVSIGNGGTQIVNSGTRTLMPCNRTVITNGYCSTPITVNSTGAYRDGTTIVSDSVVLSGAGTATVTLTNDAVFSGVNNYICALNDVSTGAAVLISHSSASEFVLTGANNSTVVYACFGLK